MEPMRGRLQNSKKYCEKEGKLIEWGQKPDQGRRTDIVGLKRKLMEGHHPMDLAIEDEGFTPIVAKFSRFAQELYQHARFKKLRTNQEIPELYIRIGPAGTGKSRWVDEQYKLDKWVEAPDNTGRWFDGCDLADVLVFNDVSSAAILPFDVLKKFQIDILLKELLKVVLSGSNPKSSFLQVTNLLMNGGTVWKTTTNKHETDGLPKLQKSNSI